MYAESYKIMKEVKGNPNKWRNILFSWIGGLKSGKMSNFPKLIFIFVIFCSTAYGGSQARVESELQLLAYATATATQDRAVSVTYTTAHGKARSLTH